MIQHEINHVLEQTQHSKMSEDPARGPGLYYIVHLPLFIIISSKPFVHGSIFDAGAIFLSLSFRFDLDQGVIHDRVISCIGSP